MKNHEQIDNELRLKRFHITLRISKQENELLKEYCDREQLTMSAALRHLIRQLKSKKI